MLGFAQDDLEELEIHKFKNVKQLAPDLWKLANLKVLELCECPLQHLSPKLGNLVVLQKLHLEWPVNMLPGGDVMERELVRFALRVVEIARPFVVPTTGVSHSELRASNLHAQPLARHRTSPPFALPTGRISRVCRRRSGSSLP